MLCGFVSRAAMWGAAERIMMGLGAMDMAWNIMILLSILWPSSWVLYSLMEMHVLNYNTIILNLINK